MKNRHNQVNNRPNDITRRGFLKTLGGVSIAAVGGATPAAMGLESTSTRQIEKPQFTIRQLSQSSEEIYECRKDLKRFSGANMAFKKVPEELGAAFSRAFLETAKRHIKNGLIGHGVSVGSSKEARAHMALNIATGTWNSIIGFTDGGPEYLKRVHQDFCILGQFDYIGC